MKRTLLFAFVLFLALKDVLGQSDAKTDCSKMDFTTVPKDCCSKPYGEVFQTTKMKANIKECSNSPSKPMEWANSYKINTIQQQDLKNFINITGKNTAQALCTNGAFMECVFRKNEWLNATGSLDINNIKEYVMGAAPDAFWKGISQKMLNPMDPIYSNAYKFTDILEDKFEKIICNGSPVNLQPLMMTQMIQSEFVWMCPKQIVPNSKNKCGETMKNFQYCDDKIYSTQARGVFFFPSV